MKITSVDYENDKVEMQDMELKGWYPIFRTESVPFVRSFVEEYYHSDEYLEKLTAQYHRDVREAEQAAAQAETEAPPAEPEQIEIDGGQISAPLTQPEYRERTVKYIRDERIPFDIEIRTIEVGPERHNFRITDDNLGAGGQKTKYQNNVAAIRTLKQIEAESCQTGSVRLATPEEQETLSRYVGWGGIAQAFDPDNDKWAKEYAELKELLTPEEYESARGTVLNAHYTRPTVIKAIYAVSMLSPDGVDKTRTGFMQLSTAAGVQVCKDGGRSASVLLPDRLEPMDYALYCRSCRALLSGAGTRGYVIADLHDPDTIAVYPARVGTECFINGYKATVAKKMITAFPEGQAEKTEVLVTAAE